MWLSNKEEKRKEIKEKKIVEKISIAALPAKPEALKFKCDYFIKIKCILLNQ